MGKKIKILCFGDSNTYGYIPGRGGRYDRHTRWPGRVQELLGSGYQIVEEGLCGRTTVYDDRTEPGRRGLDQIRSAVEKNSPLDLLLIMHSGFGSEFDRRSVEISKELAQEYEALAEKYGWEFLDGTKVTQVSQIDGLHLDADGHRRLAEAVLERVKNGL